MATDFGIDFGTTNSVAAFIGRDPKSGRDRSYVLKNPDDNRPHPSVVWFRGAEVVVGRRAKDQLGQLGRGVFGEIVRSPKMFLGSAAGVAVAGTMRPAKDIVAEILRFVREDGLRRYPEQRFDRAIATIPVPMLGPARAELREATLQAGFHVHQFAHEPLASLYGFFRSQQNFREELARLERRFVLVFDWGGGTLDITLCQVLHGALVQVVNAGDTGVGGDEFDLRLVRLIKSRHETLHPSTDWTRLQPTADARLIQACEDAKIALSTRSSSHVYVRDVLVGSKRGTDVEVEISLSDLQDAVKDLVRRGLQKIHDLMETADLPLTAVDTCLATGGMVAMPAIRDGLVEMFGWNRLRIPKTNSDTIVAEGAAWIGHDGVELRLAKPFEVLHADDSYVPLISTSTILPTEDKQFEASFGMYCVDPRDGHAKLHFARPQWPGREAAVERRFPYGHVTVKVDPYGTPLDERIDIRLTIDHNLIVSVQAESELRKEPVKSEVHDLEFGLGFETPRKHQTPIDSSRPAQPRPTRAHSRPRVAGTVRVRSNVARSAHAWHLVPGEIVQNYRPDLQDERLTLLQRHEKMYYSPCCICGRTIYEIERDGCDECAPKGKALSCLAARQRREKRARQGLPV